MLNCTYYTPQPPIDLNNFEDSKLFLNFHQFFLSWTVFVSTKFDPAPSQTRVSFPLTVMCDQTLLDFDEANV